MHANKHYSKSCNIPKLIPRQTKCIILRMIQYLCKLKKKMNKYKQKSLLPCTLITQTHNQGNASKDLHNDFMKMLTKLFHTR